MINFPTLPEIDFHFIILFIRLSMGFYQPRRKGDNRIVDLINSIFKVSKFVGNLQKKCLWSYLHKHIWQRHYTQNIQSL